MAFRNLLCKGLVRQVTGGSRSLHTSSACKMPLCHVDTNMTSEQLPKTFINDLSAVIAKSLNKNEAVVSVTLKTDMNMVRAGNSTPTAVVRLWSFGVFDAERNPKYVKDLYDFLLPTLNLTDDRVALFLHPIAKEDAGHLTYSEMKK